MDEDEELGPSLAIPPLYVLRTAARCPECGKAKHVYTLGCAAFHDAEDPPGRGVPFPGFDPQRAGGGAKPAQNQMPQPLPRPGRWTNARI